MKVIKLIFWRTTVDNYGDLLSPFVIASLSGCKIIPKNYYVGNLKSHLYHTLTSIASFDFKFKSRYLLPFERNVIGIGSILNAGNRNSNIWGAGFMSEKDRCKGGIIYAIRGKKSQDIINQQIRVGDPIRMNENVVLGDPALLLPMLIERSSQKKYKVAIIPHFSEIEYFQHKYGDKFHVIDLRSNKIVEVTQDITSCEYILSTSLHGLIVAHAYNIPALWMEYTGLEKDTNGFKFLDYFSSVGIPDYMPIKDIDDMLMSEDKVISRFSSMQSVSLPKTDLTILRQKLLSVTPFNIKLNFIRQ